MRMVLFAAVLYTAAMCMSCLFGIAVALMSRSASVADRMTPSRQWRRRSSLLKRSGALPESEFR